jgi:hypothetical protein
MSIDEASLKQTLWHSSRADLAQYAPEIEHSNVLMCPACGRWLLFDDFSLEHIIPKQALAHDPPEAKAAIFASQRAGSMLLCRKRLKINDRVISGNGCNGWKGRYYDLPIAETLSGKAITGESRYASNSHIIALMAAAFLALVSRYGYQIALTPSGVLVRRQFFMPRIFRSDMPLLSQVVISGAMPAYSNETHRLWADPFRFSFEPGKCFVVVRTLSLQLPMSRDPNTPVASRLRVAPQRYKLRPDFRTAFE